MKDLIHDAFNLLPNLMPEYEIRPDQVKMSLSIYQSLEEKKHIIVEAGTGTGKSLAYLIPMILYSLEKKERVVISTKTKTLQAQLVNKDLPMLESMFEQLGKQFKAKLVKGRSNYVCLAKLNRFMKMYGISDNGVQAAFEGDFAVEIIEQLKTLAKCHKEIKGDKGNVNFGIWAVWDLVCSESDTCMGLRKCPYGKGCYFNSARRELDKADLLILNHAMLFTDMAAKDAGSKLLPDYKAIVIDEAHSIEEIATKYFGKKIDPLVINKTVAGLFNPDSNLGNHIRSESGWIDTFQSIGKQIEEELKILSISGFMFLEDNKIARYRDNVFPTKLGGFLDDLLQDLEEFSKQPLDEEESAELISICKRLGDIRNDINQVLSCEDSDCVYWVERRKEDAIFNSAPIKIDETLKESLFAKYSTVLTSATLSTENNFNYFAKRIGISSFNSLIVSSPFDFKEQSLLFVPNDGREANSGDQNYLSYVVENLKYLLQITNGRAFALFTSEGAMRYCYRELEQWMLDKGMTPILQRGSTERILDKFREGQNPVLFATDSFWEGVDLQGDQLVSVIITKLPFAVPTNPVEQARYELIVASGGNPFMEYSLPKAVIRLRQGFGRLIRSKTDKGVVTVLDTRILTKDYGKAFLNSLPDCQRFRGKAAIEKFSDAI